MLLPPPEGLPSPGIERVSPALAGGFFTTSTTWEDTIIPFYIWGNWDSEPYSGPIKLLSHLGPTQSPEFSSHHSYPAHWVYENQLCLRVSLSLLVHCLAQHPINMSSAEYREKKFSKWGKSLPVGHMMAIVSMKYKDAQVVPS